MIRFKFNGFITLKIVNSSENVKKRYKDGFGIDPVTIAYIAFNRSSMRS